MEMENFIKLVSYLFHSRTQVHVFHLQTKSFAEHKALNDYYDEIIELVDGLIESYQGKYGIIVNYENPPLQNYTDNAQVVSYFSKLEDIIEVLKQDVEDSYIQNQIDGVMELVESTKYKLRFLS
jgi:hypothetical protein